MPECWDHGVLDVFIQHLNGEKAPTVPSTQLTPDINRALMSLTGILQSTPNIQQNESQLTSKLLKAWPGIFKWSVFFAATRDLPNATPQSRRTSSDLISGSWFALTRSTPVKVQMVGTIGSIEIMTKLWFEEDAPGQPPSMIDIPSSSAVLDQLLRNDLKSEDPYDDKPRRFLNAAGGNAKNVAKLMMTRMKKVMTGPRTSAHENRITIYLDLIGHMSMTKSSPLRHAFLSLDIIPTCTKVALATAKQLNNGGSPDGGYLIGPLVASLGYLVNCIESTDGFSWVVQAIKAGLLIAITDLSPHWRSIDPEEQEWLLKLLNDIIPRYMVYRSVVVAIEA